MANGFRRTGLDALKLNTQNRFRFESLGLLVAACLFIATSHTGNWFGALDRLIYDSVIARTAAPMAPELVLVGIDDQSLHKFGPWPWPRRLQAQLLNAINDHQPEAVLMDVIYTGEDADNPQLVAAAARVEQLALPMMVDALAQGEQYIEVLPFPNLLDHADIIGHVQIERDADAIVRGTHLYQGVGTPHWPHVMLALANSLYDYPMPGCNAAETRAPLQIRKCRYVRFPFAGVPGSYPQISATHLLTSGQIAPATLKEALSDKVVLVGVTALGGSDWVTSPLGNQSTPLSGVEFNANLLSALMSGSLIRETPDWLVIVIGMLLVALCALSLPRLRPKQALAASLGFAVLPILGTIVLLALFWIALPLANVTAASLLIYPLWSWRRHEIAWSFIQGELDRVEGEEEKWQLHRNGTDERQVHRSLQRLLNAHITLPSADSKAAIVHRDSPLNQAEQALLNHYLDTTQATDANTALPAERLAAQIDNLEARTHQLRQSRDIGLAGLDRMNSGAIIVSDLGETRFINKAAIRLLGWQEDLPLLSQLERITPPLGQNWHDIWRATVLEKRSVSFESVLEEKPVFLNTAPLDQDTDQGYASFWVLTVSDLSDVRQAQAQREEALAFLSHDLRSPLASILALIRQLEDAAGNSPLIEQLQRYAQKSLAASDQFLQLSRLQLNPSFETYMLEFEQVIHNAIEQVYFLAREKQIDIEFDECGRDDGIWIEGNGELLERALVNLLGNAIKYSSEGTTTTLSTRIFAQTVSLRIRDSGYGIPEDEVRHIFEPYFRSAEPRLAQGRGAGLGLRFVKTVVERHGGEITVSSEWGEGTTFEIRLPMES